MLYPANLTWGKSTVTKW